MRILRFVSLLICTLAMACVNGNKRPSGVACPTDNILYSLETTIAGSGRERVFAPGEETLADVITRKLRQRAPDSSEGLVAPRSLLALSGGGPWGAYGAGFMSGWTTTESRPSFDVVTGVSTGALIAPFAFLGADYDGALVDAYTITSESDLVRERGLLALLSSNAFLERTGLEARIEAMVDIELLTRLANVESNRGLFVGIVDADSGEFFAVDLLELARRAKTAPAEAEACFEAYLLASTSVPAAFPPIFIEDVDRPSSIQPRMFVDGGARQTVFFEDIETSVLRMMESDTEVDLNVIVNGDLEVSPKRTKNTLLGIADRGSSIIIDQVSLTSLDRLVRLGQREGWNVRYTTARNHACDAAAEQAEGDHFNPAFMSCLIDYGKERWASNNPWDRSASSN